jgi:hypothetical protein
MQTATRPNREAMQQEALTRAATGQSLSNWPAIIHGFIAKGIPESDIRPRENVFTFHAWRALGRTVRRGEHGVKVTTYVSGEREEKETDQATGEERAAKRSFRRPWTATVFHVSQTDPIVS